MVCYVPINKNVKNLGIFFVNEEEDYIFILLLRHSNLRFFFKYLFKLKFRMCKTIFFNGNVSINFISYSYYRLHLKVTIFELERFKINLLSTFFPKTPQVFSALDLVQTYVNNWKSFLFYFLVILSTGWSRLLRKACKASRF